MHLWHCYIFNDFATLILVKKIASKGLKVLDLYLKLKTDAFNKKFRQCDQESLTIIISFLQSRVCSTFTRLFFIVIFVLFFFIHLPLQLARRHEASPQFDLFITHPLYYFVPNSSLVLLQFIKTLLHKNTECFRR